MGATDYHAQLGLPYKGQRVDCLLVVTYYTIVGVRVSHPISYSGFSDIHNLSKITLYQRTNCILSSGSVGVILQGRFVIIPATDSTSVTAPNMGKLV